MIINVDCDGVLVPNVHEVTLMNKVKEEGLSFEDTSVIWDWYDRLINLNPLPVNTELMMYLTHMKSVGHVIRLWTNRSYTLRTATERDMGAWLPVFDDMQFYAGRKSQSKVEGMVIDNSIKYLNCGEVGIHYEWR